LSRIMANFGQGPRVLTELCHPDSRDINRLHTNTIILTNALIPSRVVTAIVLKFIGIV
jgi:hypothetical protein